MFVVFATVKIKRRPWIVSRLCNKVRKSKDAYSKNVFFCNNHTFYIQFGLVVSSDVIQVTLIPNKN